MVLWLSGGPGCSSFGGMIMENGPVTIKNGHMDLEVNDWSWNKIANMIYLESPVGVGFSINNDKNHIYNDNTTAADSLKAL